MNKLLYPRLAVQNIKQNAKFYVPYLLTVIGTVAAFYISYALANADDLPQHTRYAYLSSFMHVGILVIALFSIIFLFYTNSFLIKRRKKEIGLFNILGMGKGHIAVILSWETMYLALCGIGGGLFFGILLQRLISMVAFHLMRSDKAFGLTISIQSISATVILFGIILLANLLNNLRQVHIQSPAELLREGGAGEREPKTRIFLALLGIVTLGGGYGIALLVRSNMEAFVYYFLAVILVIIGTYCLFTAVSIAILKILRANKGFYYRPSAFIGISSMLYRMKRNAVGLANICILSTMVLVMVSGTLALYIGSGDMVNNMFPEELCAEVEYKTKEAASDSAAASEGKQPGLAAGFGTGESSENTASGNEPFQPEAMQATLEGELVRRGMAAETTKTLYFFETSGSWIQNGIQIHRMTTNASYEDICAVTAAEYARWTGQQQAELAEDEILLFSPHKPGNTLRLVYMADEGSEEKLQIYRIKEQQNKVHYFGSHIAENVMVVANDTVLENLAALSQDKGDRLYWLAHIRTDGTPEQNEAMTGGAETEKMDFTGTGNWVSFRFISRDAYEKDTYALNGGFFFLGMFLGSVFLMATALIIYYKQISEGYEDRERFHIMQQVGLEKRMVRRSIRSQVLVVFALPLVIAAVHVAFDFRLMTMLLTLFRLYNVQLTLICTGAVLAVFGLVYGVVYLLTARTYYKIIQ